MKSWQFGGVTLYQGNCLDVLPTLPAESVQACITSPPYWGLRDYGTARWEGGDAGCDHSPGNESRVGRTTLEGGTATAGHKQEPFRDTCRKCGAIRIDQQLGLERVPDCLGWATKQPCGECYVCHTVAWAREVRRVLRDDGVLWLVLGDSYASIGHKKSNSGYGTTGLAGGIPQTHSMLYHENNGSGLKHKDLCGIPWRVALALQADGWWLRSDVIWAKPNPMPESVTDRPTKAHEYIFILTKNARYYWDADAVRQPHCRDWTNAGGSLFNAPRYQENSLTKGAAGEHRGDGPPRMNPNGANIKTVWTIATTPYKNAHFATFPPALIEPMVKAATSERGCCPKCGKAWERMVEKEQWPKNEYVGPKTTFYQEQGLVSNKTGLAQAGWRDRPIPSSSTLGWSPACTCDAGDPIPCTILDPFGGSGTVASVALRLGRRAILCELNPDYIELQKERVGQTQPALIGI